MILDDGICSIFRQKNTAKSGEMPRPGFELLAMGWYGEMSFETSPSRPTDGRKELKTDARIRILQCREIRQNDVAVLQEIADFAKRQEGETVYRITRAYHGKDDKSGELISDLSLEVIEP